MLPMMNAMSPERALAILDRAAARAPLTRDEHGQVMQAVQVLRPMVSPPAQAARPDEDAGDGVAGDGESQEGGTEDA